MRFVGHATAERTLEVGLSPDVPLLTKISLLLNAFSFLLTNHIPFFYCLLCPPVEQQYSRLLHTAWEVRSYTAPSKGALATVDSWLSPHPASSLLWLPHLLSHCLLCSIFTSALLVCQEIKSWLLDKRKMKCNLIVDNSAVISLFVVGCFFLFPSHTEINTSLAIEISEGSIHLALRFYFYCGNCNFCKISLYKIYWWSFSVQGYPRMTELWDDAVRLEFDSTFAEKLSLAKKIICFN